MMVDRVISALLGVGGLKPLIFTTPRRKSRTAGELEAKVETLPGSTPGAFMYSGDVDSNG